MNAPIMDMKHGIILTVLLLLFGLWLGYWFHPPDGDPEPLPAGVDRILGRWTGDLEETLSERRFIRALVSYSQTGFFIDNGTPRGIEYELLKDYEAFLNQKRESGDLEVKITFTVLPFERLLPALIEGRGDIAAAGMTITNERLKQVAFTQPYITDISEVLVSSGPADQLQSVEDLYGQTVYVLSESSYASHLQKLNRTSARGLRRPIDIVPVDSHLEEEAILQMVNAGIFELTVVDSHIAAIWSRVLENIHVHPNIVINRGGEIAWAVRQNNPQLLDSLNRFLMTRPQGSFALNLLVERYFHDTRWIQNPLSQTSQEKFQRLMTLFQKYGELYDFDWLKIAALAYQESRLNHSAVSHRGAVGIMQVMPVTAAAPPIEIPDISTVADNIHAGVKYLAHLRDTHFNHPDILPEHRMDFAIAAYNAGPTRINRLRRQAAEQGLDPNRWFFNVEYAARQDIGWETVKYVSMVYVYYVAYRTAYELGKLRQQSETGGA